MRKPTKCFSCPDPPAYLITSIPYPSTCHPVDTSDRPKCGFENRGACMKHARPFVFGAYKLVPLFEGSPWREKKKKKNRKPS